MKNFVICLLALLLNYAGATADFKIDKINYVSNDKRMYDLLLFDKDYGVAVGEYGVVRIIRNEGKDVMFENIGSNTDDLNALAIKKADELFCVGNNGKIFQSLDKGINWVQVNSSVDENLKDIEFINSETAFIVGNNGTLLYTNNGGTEWIRKDLGININLNKITLSDDKIFICGDEGLLLISNIDTEFEFITVDLGINVNYQHIKAIGNKIYLMGDYLTVFISNDNGETFKRREIEPNFNNIFRRPEITSFYFFDENTGVLKVFDRTTSSPQSYEYYTSNGGISWYSRDIHKIDDGKMRPHVINSYDFIDKNFGLAIATDGRTFRAEFKNIYLDYEISLLNFTRWAESLSANSETGGIAVVTTSGDLYEAFMNDHPSSDASNWYIPTQFDIVGKERAFPEQYDFELINENRIVIAMKSSRFVNVISDDDTTTVIKNFGYLVETYDYGKTWFKTFEMPDYYMIYEISKIQNPKETEKDYIYLTTNDSRHYVEYKNPDNWRLIKSPDSTTYINQLLCFSMMKHIAVLNYGNSYSIAYLTEDGGNSWDTLAVLPKNFTKVMCDESTHKSRLAAIGNISNGTRKSMIAFFANDSKNWNIVYETPWDYNNFILSWSQDDMNYYATMNKKLLKISKNSDLVEEIEIDVLEEQEFLRDIVVNNDIFLLGNYCTLTRVSEIISSVSEDNDFEAKIYPNPASDYIEISGLINLTLKRGVDEIAGEIKIYNTYGEMVITVGKSSSLSPQSIDISHLPIGTYYVKIGSRIHSFIVLR